MSNALDLELVSDETAERWLRETRWPSSFDNRAGAVIMLLIRERDILKKKLAAAGGEHPPDPLLEKLG